MHDTIVIGSDLSSLVASAVISRHGMKTALLSESEERHLYSDSGYTFNIEPLPLTGFGTGQICSRLLEDLGISAPAWSGLKLLNPGLQIFLPDHRVDCFHKREKLLNDMEREFPNYADEIRKLYSSVLVISNLIEQRTIGRPYAYSFNFSEFLSSLKTISVILKERYSLLKRSKSIAENPSLVRVFEAENAILSNSTNNLGSPFTILSAPAISVPLRGLYHHVGGIEALRGLLKSAFETFGGNFIGNCSVIRISANEEIDVDVSISGTLSQIRGRYLIASTKWEKIGLLHASGRNFRRMERRLASIKSAYYPFTLHMGVLERCIPERMATYAAFIIDQNRPVIDDNLVFVELSPSDCKERAPLGKRALSGTILLKKSPLVMTNDELEEVSQFVFSAVEKFLPFLRENLDFIDIGKSIELSRDCQKIVQQKYSMRSGSFFGQSYIFNKPPIRNVFMTGGMLRPGLRFEGEIMSGLIAANSVLSKERDRHG